MALCFVISLSTHSVSCSPESAATLSRAARTTVQNAMWKEDAFPTSPILQPGKALTISYYNASGGGRVTMAHVVLWGPPRELIRRHVALRITYDDLSYPSVFVPVGDFFMESAPKNGTKTSSFFETPYMAYRPSRSWYSFFHMPYRHSIRIELVGSPDLPQAVQGEVWTQHQDSPWDAATDSYFHSRFAYQPRLRFPWQPAVWSPPGGWRGPGQLVGISMRFSAPAPW